MEYEKQNDALKILLVEGDTNVCADFVSYIDNLKDARLVGVTNSSYKALELISDHLPDALILDLELTGGSGNGLMLLNDLRSLDPSIIPYTIITTYISSPTTFESAHQLGADFIFSKHQPDYSPRSAVDFLRLMRSTIQSRRKTAAASSVPTESKAVMTRRINNRISAELDQLGMRNSLLGYQYLIDAIVMYAEKPVQNIPAILGKRYEKSSASVERAMQNAIDRTWNSSPTDILDAYYTAHIDPNRECPTILEFVTYYAKKVKTDF